MTNFVAIISSYNRMHYLKKIVHQVENQILPDGIKISIIVVIDGSTDGTYEMLVSDFPLVHALKGPGNWWWTKCMIEGYKMALKLEADYILIFNDDSEIEPDYIATLWTDYQTLPKDTILGSASVSLEPKDLIDFAGTKDLKFWCMKATAYLPNLTPLFSGFKGIYPTWTINGRGSLVPISVFNKIGIYDERLVQYGSDDEFAIRARKAGLPVYISWNARVYNHLLMTSEGTAFRKDSFWKFLKSFYNPYSVNSFKKTTYLYKKHGIKILTPIYLIYTFLGTLKAYLFKYKHI
jgi:GT2 family glycosyltransferase